MRNNQSAMLATVALAGLGALLLGFFDEGSCVVPDAEGFTSCSEIANQRVWAAVILIIVAVVGFTISIVRKRRR